MKVLSELLAMKGGESGGPVFAPAQVAVAGLGAQISTPYNIDEMDPD